MSGEKRPDGYYWVRLSKQWEIAWWDSGTEWFRIDRIGYPASDMKEIGPPCNRDDAEQLQKARELNRRALAIIADAIMHGMPVTKEVADVRNQIVASTKVGVRL